MARERDIDARVLEPHQKVTALLADAVADGVDALGVAGGDGSCCPAQLLPRRQTQTLLETTAEVLGPSRAAPDLRLVDDLGHEHRHPSVVLVSNNPYALDHPVSPATRPRLDEGSSASSCSISDTRARIFRPEPGQRRTSGWTRKDRCMPASTAELSNWTRRLRA